MRWKAIYLILAIFIIIGTSGYFFFDHFLGWTIEKTIETVIGAKVEVHHLHLDWTKLKITIGNLQITNPSNTWRNLIETKNISFQLAAEPLFSGKIVIAEVAVADLMINSPRKTNGKIKKFRLLGPFGKAQAKINHDIANLPVLNPENINIPTDKLFAKYNMKIDFASVETRNRIEAASQKWQQNIDKLEQTKERIKVLQENLKQFKAAQTRNLVEIKEKITKLQDLQKSGGDIQQEISQTTDALKTDFAVLKENIAGLKDAAEADYHALLQLAKLPDFNSLNYTEILLGKALLNESAYIMNIVDNLQKQIPVKIENPPKEKHPRGGQDIIFPGRRTFPRFLIKHVAISAKGTPDTITEGFYIKGKATGITSEPSIYGAPLLAQVSGKTSSGEFLDFNASLDHLTPAIDDRFKLTIGGLRLPDIHFTESPILPSKISSGQAKIFSNLNMKPDYLNLEVIIEGSNLICDYSNTPSSNNLLVQIIRETLSEIDQFQINYQLVGPADQLKMNLSSNINDIIDAKLKTVIGAKLDEATQRIRQQVNEELMKKQNELNQLYEQYQTEFSTQIKLVQSMIDQQNQNVEKSKKELEQQLKKETDKAQKDLENQLEKAKKDLEDQLKQKLNGK